MFLVGIPLASALHDNFLSARYLMNQWADSYQICIDKSLVLDDELKFGDLGLIYKVTAGLSLQRSIILVLRFEKFVKPLLKAGLLWKERIC